MHKSTLKIRNHLDDATDLTGITQQLLQLPRIPHNRLHKTTLENIVLRPRFVPEQDLEIQENTITYLAPNEISNKVVRLHNWKDIKASVSIKMTMFDSVASLNKLLPVLEQSPYKINKFAIELKNKLRFTGHQLVQIIFILTRNQHEIKSLSVRIQGPEEINEAGAKLVRKALAINLRNLKRLEWCHSFALSTEVTMTVSHITRGLLRLKTLLFKFGGMKVNDFEPLASVSRDLGKNLPNLEKLCLHFWRNYSLTNQEVKSCIEELSKRFAKLSYLRFNFRYCSLLDSSCLLALRQGICGNLVNLNGLVLILDKIPKITQTELDSLTTDLSKSLPKLEYLSYKDKFDTENSVI